VPADESIKIRLREARRLKIRYGRAVLTVSRFGGFGHDDLADAVAAYEAGRVEAEEVCRIFIRRRVVDHSPSFDWGRVSFPLLLDRVAGASTSPKFSSSAPEDVASGLVEAAREEREAARRANEKLLRVVDEFKLGTFGGLGQSVLKTQRLTILGAHSPIRKMAAEFSPAIRLQEQVKTLGFGGRAPGGSTALDPMRGFRGPLVSADYLASVKAFRSPLQDIGGLGIASSLVGDYRNLKLLDTPGIQSITGRLGDLYRPPSIQRLIGNDAISSIAKRSEDWIEGFKRALPANWRELETAEVDAAVKLMLETGISVAWAPRPSVIRALLNAKSSQERQVILEDKSEEILQDVEAALDRVTSPALGRTVDACRKAIAAYRDGHPDPALSYASAILSDLVHSYFELEGFKEIRETFGDVDPFNDVDHRNFALFSVGRVWVMVFERFEGNDRGGYNRNRTLHVLGDHYSEANLLAVLMLLAGLLCELRRLEIREERRRQVEPEQLQTAA
jgi:hypothetical protein